MTTDVSIDVVGGGTARGWLATPEGAGRGPALILVHEWWGLNEDVRGLTERFATEGFLSLAVDLYQGRSTSSPEEAMALSNEMKTAEAVKVVEGAVRWLAAHERSHGKVGITGFCLGGAVSIAAACKVPGLSAAVPFYGTPRDEFADFSAKRPPILGHYGKTDPIVSLDRVRTLQERAVAAGGTFELHVYDAGHAFMRQADPAAYHAPSAALAWTRTIDFLRTHLAG